MNPRCLASPTLAWGDVIWITDAILQRTLSRYCRHNAPARLRKFVHSTAHRRCLSFVPGPLECRRRMGKRQLTSVNIYRLQPNPLAVWGFVVLDYGKRLDRVEWEPPSTAHVRRQRDEVARTLRDLSDWFSNTIQLPSWLGSTDRSTSKELEATSKMAEHTASVSLAQETRHIQSMLLEASRTTEGERGDAREALLRHVDDYVSLVGRQIELGVPTAYDVRKTLDMIPVLLRSMALVLGEDHANMTARDLYLCIIGALKSSSVWKPWDLEPDGWRVLLRGILGLRDEDDALCVFAHAMSCMPKQYLPRVRPEVEATLEAVAAAWNTENYEVSDTKDARRHLERFLGDPRAGLLAKALQEYRMQDMLSFRSVWPATLNEQHDPDKVHYPALRAAWLAVIVHMPNAGPSEVTRAVRSLYKADKIFDNRILAQVLLARWHSTGLYATDPDSKSQDTLSFVKCRRWWEYQLEVFRGRCPLALLFLAICRLPNNKSKIALCVEVWRFVAKLRRPHDPAVEFSDLIARGHEVDARHVWTVAMTTPDHRTALELVALLMDRPHQGADAEPGCAWPVWTVHLQSMLEDKEISPLRILRVLHALDRTEDAKAGDLSSSSYMQGRAQGRTDIHPQHLRLVERTMIHWAYQEVVDERMAHIVVIRGLEWMFFQKVDVSRDVIDSTRRIVVRYIEGELGGLHDSTAWAMRMVWNWFYQRGIPDKPKR